MSIKRNWSRHGSEVVIRWYQRFFWLAASRLVFAASPPTGKKNLWYQGSAMIYPSVEHRLLMRKVGFSQRLKVS